jgi:hypothetical protein
VLVAAGADSGAGGTDGGYGGVEMVPVAVVGIDCADDWC